MANGLTHIGSLLVESKTKEALERLQEYVRTAYPEKLNEVALQLSRYHMAVEVFGKGFVTMAEHQAALMQINSGILALLDECKQQADTATPGAAPTGRAALNEYHTYTCNRIEQADDFRTRFAVLKGAKQQFYYLYGGDMHSHEGFFRRTAYDLEGRLLDYLNPDLALTCKTLQLEMTFEFSRQLDLYKQNILRSLFTMLGVSPNEHEPLLNRDLAYAAAASPRLTDLSAHDYVCIFIPISQYDWDAELTPNAARWFIRDFCGAELPAEWPMFLFFFAIEYDEEDQHLAGEVRQAIGESEQLHVLPELTKVQKRDLASWLERYKQLAINSRERRELLQQHFGETDTYYMEDVEPRLKKIIDTYNNHL